MSGTFPAGAWYLFDEEDWVREFSAGDRVHWGSDGACVGEVAYAGPLLTPLCYYSSHQFNCDVCRFFFAGAAAWDPFPQAASHWTMREVLHQMGQAQARQREIAPAFGKALPHYGVVVFTYHCRGGCSADCWFGGPGHRTLQCVVLQPGDPVRVERPNHRPKGSLNSRWPGENPARLPQPNTNTQAREPQAPLPEIGPAATVGAILALLVSAALAAAVWWLASG